MQVRAHDRDAFERAWPHVLARIDAAAASGARLIVVPEGTVPAYVLGTASVDPAMLARAARDVASLARRHRATIVYGAAKIVQEHTFNCAIAVGPSGEELGFAAKHFLWHFDRRWFAPGDRLEPVDTPLGRFGLLVCADGRIPSIAATLVERGAELLVMPTAWVTSGRDSASLENVQADLMIGVRARENGIPFVAANKVGVERASVAYCGKSALVAADGSIVARGGEREEATVAGELVLGAPARPPRAPQAFPEPAVHERGRARIALTPSREIAEIEALADLAAQADADVLVAGRAVTGAAVPVVALDGAPDRAVVAGGVHVVLAATETARAPRGLVAARAAGFDCFAWTSDADEGWVVPFARTRAAELRAYAIVIDRTRERAFAVDPDGAVVAGTYDEYRLASFAYDPARAALTQVAPATDVAAGLRAAERRAGAGSAIGSLS